MRTIGLLLGAVLLIGTTGSASAQRPSVPVIIKAGDTDPCGNGIVVGLDPRGGMGLLTVRSVPASAMAWASCARASRPRS
jgi:hypothetical protein